MRIKDLTSEQLEIAASMLKAIAHPVRMEILDNLDKGKKLNVTEIHKMLGIEQSSASHHLGILKDKGVLLSMRKGKRTFYYLKHDNIANIIECVSKCAG